MQSLLKMYLRKAKATKPVRKYGINETRIMLAATLEARRSPSFLI